MLYYALIHNKSYKDYFIFHEMSKRVFGRINVALKIVKGVKNWPHVFLNYFKISHDDFILFKLRSGEEVRIKNIENKMDTSGIATIFEIFLMNNYCPRGMEIKDSDVVIDIGANIGVFSLYAGNKARQGKIYAYEPFETHHKRFLANIGLNDMKNIFAFNLGISGEKGRKDLFLNDQSSGMHSIVFDRGSKNKISIKCITLEDIFRENKLSSCDFLKMDCEGAEYDIIFKTPTKIFKKIKKISLEFDNIDNERNCFKLKELLESNGFEVKIKGAYEHQGILYARKKD